MDELLDQHPGVQETMRQLVGEAVRTTFCDSASLVMATDGVVVGTSATSDAATAADDLQWQDEEGPALQSLRSRQDYMTGDIAHDTRWLQWGPHAAALGLTSVVSKQLQVRNETAAALVLYAELPNAYSERDLHVAEIFARYAAVALASAHARDALVQASDDRQTIGIAEGILMQRHQLAPGAAFDILRERGREDHTTLLQTAVRIAGQDPALP